MRLQLSMRRNYAGKEITEGPIATGKRPIRAVEAPN